jgi:hypothetical protein
MAILDKYQLFLLAIIIALLTSCRTSYQTTTVSTGHYKIIDTAIISVFIEDFTDSLEITDNGMTSFLPIPENSVLRLRQNSFDADVFSVPFKIRPSYEGFPPQFDAGFHLAFYAGRRHDYYKIGYKAAPNKKLYRYTKKIAFGYGGFVGIAAATMRPEVMRQMINYEYEGVTLDAGIAGIVDIGAVNVGIAIGFDHLVDKNRNYWIYQQRPWVGVLLGLNLN